MAARAAEEHVRAAARNLGDAVALDLKHRRLFLSDALVAQFVRTGARHAGEVEIQDFAWDGTAYRCRATVGGRTLAGRLTVERAEWRDGQLTLRGKTPDPVTIEGAPIATWLLGQFVELFGGTSTAEHVLGVGTPPGVVWDGADLSWTQALDADRAGVASPVLRAIAVAVGVTHDAGGIWLAVDAELPAFMLLARTILGPLSAGRSGV